MGDLVNVDAFRDAKPAAAFANMDPMQDRLSDGIGGGYGVIGYKGGKAWTLKYRGETHMLLNEKREPARVLTMVILGSAPHKSKSYFPNYVEGSTDRPICAALDGLKPDPDVQTPQAQACVLCPHNAFKVLENGRKGKECNDYKRLAVLLAPALTASVMGEPLLEPVFLRVPAASLQALGLMGDDMARRGFPYPSYYATVEFDVTQAYPKMVFKAVHKVSEEDAIFIKELLNDPLTKRIVEGGFGDAPRQIAAPEPVQQVTSFTAARTAPQPAPNAAAPSTVVMEIIPPQKPVAPVATVVSMGGFAAAKAAKAAAEAAPAAPVTGPVTGTATSAVTNDLGEPSETDAEMDARIAQEMNRLNLQ